MRLIINIIALFWLISANAYTLEWRKGDDWPEGTTTEACINGNCVSNIAGNQLIFDAKAGTVINASVRAISPDGRFSTWATLTQAISVAKTIPLGQSSLWARLEINSVAVAQVGTVYSNSNNATTSFDVDIPANANCIIVFAAGYSTPLLSAINFDGSGNDFTLIRGQRWNADFSSNQIEIYGMLSSSPNWPGTGTKTFYKTRNSSSTEGVNLVIAFFSGVSNWEQAQSRDGSSLEWTASFTGVLAGDMAILGMYKYGDTPTVNNNSQAQIAALAPYNSAGIGASYKSGASSVIAQAQNNIVPAAFLLKSFSGGSTYSYTPSGGLATGGVGTLKLAKATTASGGLTTGGAATLKRAFASLASGGTTAGGAAPLKLIKTATASGGVTTGGSAAMKRAQTATAAGGVTAGGSGGLKRTQSMHATGGMIAGGVATASLTSTGSNSYTASGGLTTGGAAGLKRTNASASSGGIETGGSGSIKQTQNYSVSGGVTTGGTGNQKLVKTAIASGGLTIGGAASATLQAGAFSHVASGGLTIGGAASLRFLRRLCGSCSITSPAED